MACMLFYLFIGTDERQGLTLFTKQDVDKVNEIKEEQKDSYRGIFKATSLFGGVQVYQILIEVIKSKFIAVLLGPLGVGIQGLYTSATQLIQQLTSFGLSSSAVRNVAEANGSGDKARIARVVYALRRLVWITGLLGMVAVIVLSPLLSKSSFGDSDHIVAFVIISVTLLLTQLSAGQKVVLQGTRRLKLLAKASTIGVTLGLIIAVPLYYWLGVEGIVPNIVITAATTLLITWYYSKKVEIEKVIMTNKEVLKEGKSMLVMGIAMSLSQLLASGSAYALRACMRLWGGVEVVGLFTAGYILMTQYTGLVFNAMGTDYYPRLASVNGDNAKCRQMMNQQGEIGMLILAPLMVVCIVFIPIVVRILYSEKFLAINSYVVWCSAGMLFKMASWAISYVFMAKGESKLFIINEMSYAVYTLLLNLAGYKLGGLTGLGISFAISYIIYLTQVFIIAHKKYGFFFENSLIRVFLIQFVTLTLCLGCVLLLPIVWKYVIGSFMVIVSGCYSLMELNKRLDLKSFINGKLHKQ